MKKNIAFTFIFFALLKWDERLLFQLPFELPFEILVQLLLELEASLLNPRPHLIPTNLKIAQPIADKICFLRLCLLKSSLSSYGAADSNFSPYWWVVISVKRSCYLFTAEGAAQLLPLSAWSVLSKLRCVRQKKFELLFSLKQRYTVLTSPL